MRRFLLTALCLGASSVAAAQVPPAPPVVGRWNLTVTSQRGSYPSWLEITPSGFTAIVGRYVDRIGGVRPIGRIEMKGDSALNFSIPPQWERFPTDMRVEARLLPGDTLIGTMQLPSGRVTPFVGRRAPSLRRQAPAGWSAPIALFNGKNIEGWSATRFARNNWVARDGLLVNTENEGANLLTDRKFQDFKLHVEFRVPKRGDSGVFLRGRYEVQIGDNADRDWTDPTTTGGVYSFLVPNQNAATAADQWQSFDITLVGRTVTVVLNGKTVIADQIIPGLSGSALDADEAEPGPIMLQGEETRVEFRNITIQVPDEQAGRSQPATAAAATGTSTCAPSDSAAASAVRARLALWVQQANSLDRVGMRDVWAPGYTGWFPAAAIFGDSAASVAAGVPLNATGRTTYDIVVDDIVASGPVVVVHDLWTETREFAAQSRKAKRIIRGSELWKCQPDGRWRIARFVSAPEPWVPSK